MSETLSVNKRWISIQYAAEAIDVDQRTIRRAINDGRLSARRFGRAIRIDAESFDRAFAQVESAID